MNSIVPSKGTIKTTEGKRQDTSVKIEAVTCETRARYLLNQKQVPNRWPTFPVVNLEKGWSSQLKTRETDEPNFHRSSKVQLISFLYYFTHPYFVTALVCVCCTRPVSGCGTLYGCMGPRCLRWWERQRFWLCVRFFVQSISYVNSYISLPAFSIY